MSLEARKETDRQTDSESRVIRQEFIESHIKPEVSQDFTVSWCDQSRVFHSNSSSFFLILLLLLCVPSTGARRAESSTAEPQLH